MLMDEARIEAAFKNLDSLLLRWRHLWQIRPFDHLDLPWMKELPDLNRWLNSLTMERIQELEADPEGLAGVMSRFVTDASELHNGSCLERFDTGQRPFNPAFNHRIPGRKWQQITAFAGCIDFERGPVLEWCAGKGHLGRLLTCSYHTPVTSLEIDAQLCSLGRTLAERYDADIRFHPVDVLASGVVRHIHSDHHVVALHACGDLHLKLLQDAAAIHCRTVSLAPCCYHLVAGRHYQPLSAAGRRSQLKLSRFDLQLPMEETVTANQQRVRYRNRELSWRLALDLLQRDLTGSRCYRNLPSTRKRLLRGDFVSFCRWAAEQWNLRLPAGIDYAHYEKRGRQRRILLARTELVRHLFRRPLEIWLVLDRALFLIQNKYRVRVGEFCSRQLTPRNILIQAHRT